LWSQNLLDLLQRGRGEHKGSDLDNIEHPLLKFFMQLTSLLRTPRYFGLFLILSILPFTVFSQDRTVGGEERSYLSSHDLDGDSIPDRVSFAFTGGAHCCYKPHIFLSKDSIERSFPFRMDGGYVGGIDGSKPEQFRIEDLDGDSIAEVYMRIEVYNDRQRDIPEDWTRKYGITKNRIYFDHDRDSLRVLDME
jgi:hypothetical protein